MGSHQVDIWVINPKLPPLCSVRSGAYDEVQEDLPPSPGQLEAKQTHMPDRLSLWSFCGLKGLSSLCRGLGDAVLSKMAPSLGSELPRILRGTTGTCGKIGLLFTSGD
jgi:hypothetical protein